VPTDLAKTWATTTATLPDHNWTSHVITYRISVKKKKRRKIKSSSGKIKESLPPVTTFT